MIAPKATQTGLRKKIIGAYFDLVFMAAS